VLRVALCNDFAEEQWPSMDRVANELATEIGRHADTVELTPVCPRFVRRAMRVPAPGVMRAGFTIDRALNRWWDYPRHVRSIVSYYDCFHVIDHSYAQLVHELPASRTVVTCHDLDTFRSVLVPADEPRTRLFRMATERILTGLQKASRVTCDTAAVRDELLEFGLLAPARVAVVPVGVGDVFAPAPDILADRAAARLVDAGGRGVEILHVGSTIPRKRIDTLLMVCAALVQRVPDLRVVRVGSPFTRAQEMLVDELGLRDRVTVIGFVNERTLAALYRRAALVLVPSEREGFGLPLVESIACGTPVVASDLPVLKEVGGSTVDYCPVGDVGAWVRTINGLLVERRAEPHRWIARQRAGRLRSRCFSWSRFASEMTDIYAAIADEQAGAGAMRAEDVNA
jgi:glycosyltransferase involved in cell wall biosynthesis